ncbi:MAG: hypothetical protein KAU14_01420, partial [Thermoplasmata archaeon]|nr:hypothetical protein [Thermoplasmata archaeon]
MLGHLEERVRKIIVFIITSLRNEVDASWVFGIFSLNLVFSNFLYGSGLGIINQFVSCVYPGNIDAVH